MSMLPNGLTALSTSTPGGGWLPQASSFNLQLFAGEDKTEPATPKRREEARKRGQVVRSPEVGIALGLLVVVFFLRVTGRGLMQVLTWYVQEGLTRRPQGDLNFPALMTLGQENVFFFLRTAGPLLGILFLLSLVVNFGQVGFLLSGTPLVPQFSRINPMTGAQRLFSKRALVELAKALFKVAVVGWLAYNTFRGSFHSFVEMGGMDFLSGAGVIAALLYRLGIRVGLAFLVLAGADYFYQRWEHEQALRMSKQEVKEEFKQMEGDPQMRGRIRQRQRQMALRRMMAAVPKADVVLTNPTHLAVALLYEQEKMVAPTVVAKGQGYLAERIKAVAREHGVIVLENKPLAQALFAVEVGAVIPPELYQAVAEVLAFVYQQRHKVS